MVDGLSMEDRGCVGLGWRVVQVAVWAYISSSPPTLSNPTGQAIGSIRVRLFIDICRFDSIIHYRV
jgi:hypothetical protein